MSDPTSAPGEYTVTNYGGTQLRQSHLGSGYDAGRGLVESYLSECEAENRRLRAKVAVMEDVVQAARAAVGGSMGGYVALKETLVALDRVRAKETS